MRQPCRSFAPPCALLLAAAALVSLGAHAEELERVEVVGSRLKQIPQETAVPVSVFRRDEIDASGALRVADFLRTLPFAGAGTFDGTAAIGDAQLGASGLSLRGLGPGGTLVLLNGRRLAAYGVALLDDSTFVDLNTLPLAAVERIEVLRDGASAIYGADAIGGVVNVVLRRDWRGVELAARLEGGAKGAAPAQAATLSAGTGSLAKDGHNAFIVLDLLHQGAVPAQDRAFSASSDQRARGGSDWRVPFGIPPTVRPLGQPPQPAAGCPPARIAPLGNGTGCMSEGYIGLTLPARTDHASVLAVGTLQAREGLRVFGEVGFSHNDTLAALGLMPFRGLLGPGSPVNPYGQPILVSWSPPAPATNRTTTNFRRGVGGLEWDIGRWQLNVAAGVNDVATQRRRGGELRTSGVLAGWQSGALDPFAAVPDPAALAAAGAAPVDRYASGTRFVQAVATRDLAQLTHGTLSLAAGAEWRREHFGTQLDPLTLAGELFSAGGLGTSDAQGERTATAVFAELGWPLARGLELQLAARHDRYSDFGGRTSPKVALRWQPAEHWLLRGSVGRGFLAPTLQQIHKPRVLMRGGTPDPQRCPATGLFEDCIGSFDTVHVQEGNPGLRAERSRQYNLGFVLEPRPGWSVALDTWRIVDEGKIDFLGSAQILANEASLPGAVVRAPASPQDAALGIPGRVLEIRETYVNIAQRDVRGTDLELRLRGLAAFGGRLGVQLLLSHLDRFLEREAPGADAVQKAGLDGRARVRAQLGAQWQGAPWRVGAALRFTGAYRDTLMVPGTVRDVASWTVLDLQVAHVIGRGELTLGVRNLLDRWPPFVDTPVGYDFTVHDGVARTLWVAWRQPL